MSTTGTARPAAVATATALGGLAALHVLWATGSTFPVHDADEFAETFLGVDGVGSPGPGACLAVAGALGASDADNLDVGGEHRHELLGDVHDALGIVIGRHDRGARSALHLPLRATVIVRRSKSTSPPAAAASPGRRLANADTARTAGSAAQRPQGSVNLLGRRDDHHRLSAPQARQRDPVWRVRRHHSIAHSRMHCPESLATGWRRQVRDEWLLHTCRRH